MVEPLGNIINLKGRNQACGRCQKQEGVKKELIICTFAQNSMSEMEATRIAWLIT